MKKNIIVAILASVIFCFSLGAATMAYFKSQAISSANKFSTGTLILGESYNGSETSGTFAHFTIKNMMPGESVNVGNTELKNMGTLPLCLYKISASNFKGDNYSLKNEITINLRLNHKLVYTGKLSHTSEWASYFEPVNMLSGEIIQMDVETIIDEDAGNEFQNNSMAFDLTIFASQYNMPLAPQNITDSVVIANSIGFSYYQVRGYNSSDYAYFKFIWYRPDDSYSYYEINLKNEDDDKVARITAERIGPNNPEKTIHVYDDYYGLSSQDIKIDWYKDRVVIGIKKSALPDNWRGFRAKFFAKSTLKDNGCNLPYVYWPLY